MKSRFVEGLNGRLNEDDAGWWGWNWKRTITGPAGTPGFGRLKLTEFNGDTLIMEVDFAKVSEKDLIDFCTDENHRLRKEVRKLFRDSADEMKKRLK